MRALRPGATLAFCKLATGPTAPAGPISGAPDAGKRLALYLARRRITYLLRRALGDLFLGPYSAYFGLRAPGCPPPSDGDRSR